MVLKKSPEWQEMSAVDAKELNLTPRQTALMTGLVEGKSLSEAARAARISERTAARYVAAEEFRRVMREVQRQRLELVVSQAHGVGDAAVEVLQQIAADPAAPASARVAAARHLDARRWRALEFGSLRAEVDEVKERLEVRERELALCQTTSDAR